jgi:MFS family permease
MLLNLPAGFLSDRFGRRLLLVGGPVITSLGYFLSGLAGDIWQLLAFRFVAGAGSAMFMTGAMTLITDIATPENRGRMLAYYQGSLLAGVSVGPAIGGITAELAGLRAPFFLVGALSGLCALWALREMPETNRPTTRAAHAERSSGQPSVPLASSLRPLLTNMGFTLVSLVTFSIFFTRTGARQTILALQGHEEFGLSEGALGGMFAMMAFINLVTIAPAGAWADRYGRKRVIVPSGIVTAGALALFAVTGNVTLFFVAAVLQALGTGILGPAPAAYAADVVPEEARGLGMGLYRTYADVGFVVGPPLLGWIADATDSFAWPLWFNAALVAGSALAFGLFARETAASEQSRLTARAPVAS